MGVGFALFPVESIEEISGIKLEAGFGGFDGESAAGGGFGEDGGGHEFAVVFFLEDEVVIVAKAVFELLVLVTDAVADAGGFVEVEGGVFDGGNAGGDGGGIDGGVVGGVDLEVVVKNGFGAVAGEVEVGMVGEIDDGGFIGGGFIVDVEGVFIGPGVGDGGFEGAGVAFFTVGAGAGEGEDGFFIDAFQGGVPDFFIEALFATVEMVGFVVGGEGVFLAIEGEFSFGDAVRVAAGDAAEVGAFFAVFVESIEAEDDVGQLAVFVGDLDRNDGAPII